MSLIRRLATWLPGFCCVCGKRYLKRRVYCGDVLDPSTREIILCPDRHEGYFPNEATWKVFAETP